VGFSFFGVRRNRGIQNTQGILYLFTNENTFAAMGAVMAVFPLEFPVFMREHKAGLYDVNSYYISKIISSVRMPNMPFDIILIFSRGEGENNIRFILVCLCSCLDSYWTL
jgi:hypothetical protein